MPKMNINQIITPRPDVVALLFSGTSYPETANFGMIFDRYLSTWEDSPSLPKRQSTLSGPLEDFVDSFNRLGRDPLTIEMLEMANNRRKEFLNNGRYISGQYETTWHLVTGMGTDHPIENGFVFDPVLGVPILPGSGIKGLCRQAAKLKLDDDQVLTKLFGPEPEDNRDGQATQGCLVFYDAFPTSWPRLCVDIINCHHSSYYRQLSLSESDPVLVDVTEPPTSVFFIALDRGVRFNFFVRIKDDTKVEEKDVKKILDFALTKIGFGAKTAVGYGVMIEASDNIDTQVNTSSEETTWLNTAVQELMERLKTSHRDEILRGQGLAEKWKELPDGLQKDQALEQIRRIWEQKGWWQNPRGKALKKALTVYKNDS